MTTTWKTGHFLTALAKDVEAELTTIRLANSEQAVPRSRPFLQDQLSAWGFTREDELTDRVLLAASELVTNSVLHGRTRHHGEPEMIGLALPVKPGAALGILVTDHSPEAPVQTICARHRGGRTRSPARLRDRRPLDGRPGDPQRQGRRQGRMGLLRLAEEADRERADLRRTPMEVP
ncbi:hypothetical protein [Streptomyces roseoviridis]|uniref:ATP-binding protein n=1 Tax=Streptomyces roseoviridis TaxID=67361 RepID=A0ABV5QY69_9ACTN